MSMCSVRGSVCVLLTSITTDTTQLVNEVPKKEEMLLKM